MPDMDTERCLLNIVLDALIIWTCCSIVVVLLVVLLCGWFDPRGMVFLGALIPAEYFSSAFTVGLTFLNAYTLLIEGANTLWNVTVSLIYLYYLVFFITKELPPGRSRYSSSDMLREAYHFKRIYRCFQVYNAHVMGIFGFLFFFAHFVFSTTPMFINFVLIRYWQELHAAIKLLLIIWVAGIVIFWTGVLHTGGCLFLSNKKIISFWRKYDRWKTEGEAKGMRKFAKSCTPIVICFGKQFVVKSLTLLKFHKGLGRGILRALLTTKRN